MKILLKNIIKFVLLKILLINGRLKILIFTKDTFHILGGTISSPGQRKEDLLIDSLTERVIRENIEEVIIATSATIEGQTTAYYIQNSLKKTNTRVTKLAQGLPVGGEIENLDDGTLFSAFKNRTGIKTS